MLYFLFYSDSLTFFVICCNENQYWCSVNIFFSGRHADHSYFYYDETGVSYCFILRVFASNIGIILVKKRINFSLRCIFEDTRHWNCLEILFHHLWIHVLWLYLYKFHRMNHILPRNKNIYGLDLYWIFYAEAYKWINHQTLLLLDFITLNHIYWASYDLNLAPKCSYVRHID